MKLPILSKLAFAGAASLLLSLSAHAALTAVDLDGNATNGHEGVYDDVLDITWLADANYAQTSVYDSDGRISWNEAETLIANMNTGYGGSGYLGVNTWRQASASGVCFDFGCGSAPTDSDDELGYHFYQNFGATQQTTMTSGSNYTNIALFANVHDYLYWTGTETSPGSPNVFFFATLNGSSQSGTKYNTKYMWAVADGNVAANAVPVPGAVWLFGSGLLGLLGIRKFNTGV